MSKGRYFGHAALAMISLLVIAACSSDTPTSPATASKALTSPDSLRRDLMQAAPTIALSTTYVRNLCYPAIPGGNRPCYSGFNLYITNTGGGALNWTSTKSATWIKRSPRYGTAPSTMKVWIDGTGMTPGITYYGRLKVWATGATNSPQTVFISAHRWY